MTLHQQLKRGTQALHRQLEHNPLNTQLMAASLTTEQYAYILSRYYLFYQALEPQIAAHLETYYPIIYKHPWLVADLKVLDWTPPQTGGPDVQLSTVDEAVGTLYVLEGATLGGQIIRRHLARILPNAPQRFFTGYGSRTGQNWRQFLGFLEQIEPKVQHDLAVNAANATFSAFDNWLQMKPNDREITF